MCGAPLLAAPEGPATATLGTIQPQTPPALPPACDGAGGPAAQAVVADQPGLGPLPAPSSTSCLLAGAGIDGERFGRLQTRGLSRRAAPIHHGPFIME